MKNMPVLLFVLCSISCGSKTIGDAVRQVPDYQALAQSKLSSPVKYVLNGNGSHVIAFTQSEPTAMRPQHSLHFVVIDIKAGKIILEESLVDGSVRWVDEMTVEYVLLMEVARNDEMSNKVITHFNIHSLKKYYPQ